MSVLYPDIWYDSISNLASVKQAYPSIALDVTPECCRGLQSSSRGLMMCLIVQPGQPKRHRFTPARSDETIFPVLYPWLEHVEGRGVGNICMLNDG